MKRNKAGVAIPGRRAGVVGKEPRSERVVKGWGPQSKTGGFQLQKVAGCLHKVPSEVGSYKPVVPCKVINREPKVQLLVEIQDPRVLLETEHYDPHEDLGGS